MSLAIETRFDKFEIDGLLGTGGMKDVYRGTTYGRGVAIKEFRTWSLAHIGELIVFLLIVSALSACGGFPPESQFNEDEPGPSDSSSRTSESFDIAGLTRDEDEPGSSHKSSPISEPLDVTSLARDLDSAQRRTEAFARLCLGATEQDVEKLHASYRSLRTDSGRWRMYRILAEVGSLRSVPLLLSGLENGETRYSRRTAAYALGRVGSRDAVSGLRGAMLGDEELQVRQYAASALGRILGREAEPFFKEIRARGVDPAIDRTLAWLLDYENRGTRTPRIVPGKAQMGVFKDTQYKVYVPSGYTREREWPLVISVHGTDGHADPYEKMWRNDAEKYGFVVLAPYFDTPTFPFYDLLQLDDVRSDLRLLDIVTVLDGLLSLSSEKFYLFGHSKGGQFVTRFVYMHPNRIMKAAACGSGNYILPSEDEYFPNGVRRHPFMRASERFDMEAVLNVPLAVVLGARELDRRKKQAEDFMRVTNEYSAGKRIRHRTQMIRVPRAGHSGTSNQPYASEFFFGYR